MAITYPLTPPASPLPRRIAFKPAAAVARSRSPFSLAAQKHVHPGQLWFLDAELPPLVGRSYAADWIAFLLSLNGREGTFLMGDPRGATPRGTPQGTPVVDGAGQTGQVLATRGWTPDATGLLLEHDWVQLGGGATARLHQVLTPVDADSSGDALIDIWPRLRTPPADGATVVTSNTVGVFELVDNSGMAWDVNQAMAYGIAFSAVEAL